jgi:type II secretory pathway pseudopilin PulG
MRSIDRLSVSVSVLILLIPKGGVPMTKSNRLGFNLVELVVLIAILVILVGLLLPAATDRGYHIRARTQANNNLRQCAIAIHNYHGVHNRLPRASGTGADIYKKDSRTMWFELLPYVEQDNAYKNNVHNAVVSAYLAPTDAYIGVPDGKINFAANIRLFGYETLGKDAADNAVDAAGAATGATLSGRLEATMACGLTLARIPHGTSNTLMLATRYADCGSPLYSTYYSASPIGTMLASGGAVPTIGVPTGFTKGAYFGAGAHNRPADPASIAAIFQVAPRLEQCRPDDAVFGHSFTPGGLSTALADASIKNIDPNMSPATFCRALCPSDNHEMGTDWPDQ